MRTPRQRRRNNEEDEEKILEQKTSIFTISKNHEKQFWRKLKLVENEKLLLNNFVDLGNIKDPEYDYEYIAPCNEKRSSQIDSASELESDDSEDSLQSYALSYDLEKSNAVCAAFTVVFLIILYFFEFLLMCIYLISSAGQNYQGQVIAHQLCSNFPNWRFVENQTSSWCDPKIFDRDFRLDLHCPCFMTDMKN